MRKSPACERGFFVLRKASEAFAKATQFATFALGGATVSDGRRGLEGDLAALLGGFARLKAFLRFAVELSGGFGGSALIGEGFDVDDEHLVAAADFKAVPDAHVARGFRTLTGYKHAPARV